MTLRTVGEIMGIEIRSETNRNSDTAESQSCLFYKVNLIWKNRAVGIEFKLGNFPQSFVERGKGQRRAYATLMENSPCHQSN